MNGLIGIKLDQTQKFLENGRRIPVTMLKVPGNIVMQIKDANKHGYSAIQVGIGNRKNASKPLLGHANSANSKTQNQKAPQYIKELKTTDDELSQTEVGNAISASDVFAVGDIVMVTGKGKGKGFAGGVKRHHFKGGPRTHGQSDRERAPGSIGQTTTPGRVYKGKRMAGNMGNDKVTIKNLEVVNVTADELWLMGLVPGIKNSLVIVQKTGTNKKFTPLYQEPSDEPQTEEIIEETSAAEATAEETTTAPEPETPVETQTTEPDNTENVNEEEVASETESVEETSENQTRDSAEAQETNSETTDVNEATTEQPTETNEQDSETSSE